MKVKLLKPQSEGRAAGQTGDVLDLPRALAKRLIREKQAVIHAEAHRPAPQTKEPTEP